jgi:hypothetical protein
VLWYKRRERGVLTLPTGLGRTAGLDLDAMVANAMGGAARQRQGPGHLLAAAVKTRVAVRGLVRHAATMPVRGIASAVLRSRTR